MKILTRRQENDLQTMLRNAAHAEERALSLDRELRREQELRLRAEKQWAQERERADKAVDALLESKGLPPVRPTPEREPDAPDPWTEDPAEVQKILTSMGIERAPDA